MTEAPDRHAQSMLPIPDRPAPGLTTYDAKDPDTDFPAAETDTPVQAGTHQVRMELAYDGGGIAKGGDVTLYYDGDPVGTGRFTGKIHWVQIDLGNDDHDHFIDPGERLRVAMARQ